MVRTLRSVSVIDAATQALLACALLAACGGSAATPHLDARAGADARAVDAPRLADASGLGDGAPGPYRHAIAIDGTDDFVAAEVFATTSSPSYGARISWDDTNLYLGYRGPDLDPPAANAATKWVFAYLDVDPGAGTGAVTSLAYNTQRATFPQGFGAEYYLRWKCDATLASLERFDGTSWAPAATAPTTAHGTQYVEMAIARAALGDPPKLGVATWMINEQNLVESSYAGLYAGNFTDGYAANLALTKYLRIDFGSSAAPNDPANAAP